MGIPESDVGDIYVDALMKAHGKIRAFECGGPAKLTTWIFGIARNVANDYHRAAKKDKTSVEFDEGTVTLTKGRDGVCAGRNVPLLKWLDQELVKLSEQDRFVVKWRAMGFSYAEIGEWLGMKEGTARVRHLRAMEKLLAAAKSVIPEEGAVPQ